MTPYNWPLNLAAHKIAPALAAGCTLVVKTSPLSPLSTLGLVRLVQSCGLPPGVLNSVNCDNCAAQAMVEHPLVNALSFTGSERVGWMLKALVPQKRVTLELGGNAIAYVEKSANLPLAAELLCRSAFAYAGQVCISLQHILIDEDVYDQFVELLLAQSSKVTIDDPKLESTLCGPVISPAQAERITDFWKDCRHCRVIQGGTRDGNRVEPTVIELKSFEAALHGGAKIANEEVFGPVVTASPVRAMNDAIDAVNISKSAIHASIFTASDEIASEFARRVRSAGIVHNDAPNIRFDGLPYGGERTCGFGREGVRYAHEEFTWPQSFVHRIDA